MIDQFYNTIETTNTAEFKDRGSKFIGYVFPISNKEDFKIKMNLIKVEHPKADHFCFAYRLGFDKNEFRASDAGEPSGSAGKPILGQIDSKSLTNTLVVVVRYFGGTLLGVPGLINAYKTTASLLLQTTLIVQKEMTQEIRLEFDYTQMNEVLKIVKQSRATVIKNESSLFSILTIDVPLIEREFLITSLKRLENIQVL